MSIPPFPSQDLAKLVLGYLAEEQLMTAYDEFLQASPYLDAHRNEYDRIFMTSLKSILAEYRAVKIFVDTCKPFALRKKIFQCTNLLEIVKFLIANVDIKNIQHAEGAENVSHEKQSINTMAKLITCELCNSLSQPNCVCKNRTVIQKPEAYASYIEASSLQSSVEATPLTDLPGNHVTIRKKNVKIQENVSSLQSSDCSAKQSFSSNISPEEYLARCESSPAPKSSDSTLSHNSTVKPTDPLKSSQNIEEFNKVLKSVVTRNKTLSNSESLSNQRISNAGTFQDFASGVSGGEGHSGTYSVPDSSTSENSNVRAPRKDVYNDNIKGPPKCQIMFQVSRVNDSIEIQTCKKAKLPKLLPKTSENQIKIISDVKVDKTLSDKISISKKKPLIPMNATSTPLMQMQTILINGTPAYKHTSDTHTFTKDEIMAMPTLIVVPASGPSQVPTSTHCNPIMTSNVSEASSSPRILGPLVIDVPANTAISNKPAMEALPDLSEQKPLTGGLIKTVDVKNATATAASVPKDNVINSETNTPHMMPPTRKSSSTPRRTSHIRVLDFTTPRRILHETINEHVPIEGGAPPVENVASGNQSSASVPTTESETSNISTKITVVGNEEGINNDTGSTKENETTNKTKPAKKYNWDADLRALVANEKPANVSHRKPKSKASKKKKSDKAPACKESETTKKSRKQSPRVKKSKRRNSLKELDEESSPIIDIPFKPTIKIITGDKMIDFPEGKTDDNHVKTKAPEHNDENIDTPETERLSLQNVIGAKLNISDFLETPYKQVLYDIQMETPKFLGPDVPDVPLSDIKIMNIPTPRFLNTPKPAQATPSSYSSRPTDYSSGGSYYKPDDQDYMPIPDLSACPVTSSKEDIIEVSVEKESDDKKSRPVRKCAKNVSYYKNSGAVKKDVEDNVDATSSCSEPMSGNSSFEIKNKKESVTSRTPRAKAQSTSRSEHIKRSSASKKRKSTKDSVVKDKSKSFMKIKPKYTPKRSTPSKNGKNIVQSPHSRGFSSFPQRKRTTSKDRQVHVASTVVPAATKSRRKSSTPRKLPCTKSFNTEICSHDTPDNTPINPNTNRDNVISNTHDSDTEHIALRWSDDGSEDSKTKDVPTKPIPIPKETEDITKIQEFIVSTGETKSDRINDGTLQRDLMKRGFDSETAKIIERDLLDDTPMRTESTKSKTIPIEIIDTKKDNSSLNKTAESSVTNELQIDESDDEVELSVHECNEETNNFFVFKHDYTKETPQEPPIKIKDNFTTEICIEDMTVRLIALPFQLSLDQDPLTVDEIDYSYKETEQAVQSISGMDKLYTPLKDSFKVQCYEIFDSTLTSIDTPLKATSPVKSTSNISVTELVLEAENPGPLEKDGNKRKRARSSSNESANSNKRTKPDADLLLKAANIQNIDIETVLTKLHGH